jgi:hypothetical protein
MKKVTDLHAFTVYVRGHNIQYFPIFKVIVTRYCTSIFWGKFSCFLGNYMYQGIWGEFLLKNVPGVND